MSFPDFHPAPNQGGRPDRYELENQAIDPDGLVLATMRQLAPWAGRTLVDLGCGSGRLALLLANAARLILRTDERPMTPEAWSRLLRQAGFARVESVDVVAEAAIVKGTKLGTAPNGGA